MGGSAEGATVLRPNAFRATDASLVQSIRTGDLNAVGEFFDRYGSYVRGILVRLLGVDNELPDLIQEVFITALRELARLDEPRALKEWLAQIAVNTARHRIRSVSRRRWLSFLPPAELPEQATEPASDHVQAAVRATYAILAQLPTDERLAFALRFMAEMELTQIAAACQVSLATIKRRLSRAERKFQELARRDEVLCQWIESGTRWGKP